MMLWNSLQSNSGSAGRLPNRHGSVETLLRTVEICRSRGSQRQSDGRLVALVVKRGPRLSQSVSATYLAACPPVWPGMIIAASASIRTLQLTPLKPASLPSGGAAQLPRRVGAPSAVERRALSHDCLSKKKGVRGCCVCTLATSDSLCQKASKCPVNNNDHHLDNKHDDDHRHIKHDDDHIYHFNINHDNDDDHVVYYDNHHWCMGLLLRAVRRQLRGHVLEGEPCRQ